MTKMPEWLPDWRNETEYAIPENVKVHSYWAWEFLRRNPEYQKEWLLLLRAGKRWKMKYQSPYLEQSDREIMQSAFHGGLNMKPGKLNQFQIKFGLHNAEPPCVETYTPRFVHEQVLMEARSRNGKVHVADIELLPEEIAVRVNLLWPLEPQLEALREKVAVVMDSKNMPQPTKRDFSIKYPIYLRVLDAQLCGASMREMAQVIYPKYDCKRQDSQGYTTIKNDLRAAKILRDKDYRFIAAGCK